MSEKKGARTSVEALNALLGVNIDNPPIHLATLPPMVRISVAPANTAYSVVCVLIRPNGTELPPITATAVGGSLGGLWDANMTTVPPGFYTLVAVVIRVVSGSVVDSGSDTRLHCEKV
jgi:hypothetical protein